MEVTLDYVEDLTEDIGMFWFKPDKPVRYVAGQFTELRLPHENMDDRGDKRWFTISSSPTEPLLAITTRNSHDAASSFKKQLFNLEPGSKLQLAEPMGDFVLPKDKSIPLFFIAGGIGITPMRSMIKWLADTGEKRDIKLLYAVHGHNEAIFKELFENYDAEVEITTERLTVEQVLKFIGDASKKLIYISGPEPMTESLFKDLRKSGVDQKQLVTDYFPGYSAY